MIESLSTTVNPHGFVLRGFASSRGRPKNKNMSLGPFNGYVHQNCSTGGTGLRATPRDVQGVERRREAAPITFLLLREKRFKSDKTLFWGRPSVMGGF